MTVFTGNLIYLPHFIDYLTFIASKSASIPSRAEKSKTARQAYQTITFREMGGIGLGPTTYSL